MKLRKIGGVYHAAFRTADGTAKTVTTRSRDRLTAAEVVAESGVAELEMAARAGRLTREAIGKIIADRKLTLATALKAHGKLMQACARSTKTIANNLSVLQAWVGQIAQLLGHSDNRTTKGYVHARSVLSGQHVADTDDCADAEPGECSPIPDCSFHSNGVITP